MSQHFWYNDVGTWREITKEMWAFVDGAWRRNKQLWYNDGGVWKQIFTGGFNNWLMTAINVKGQGVFTVGSERRGNASMTWNPDGSFGYTYSDSTGHLQSANVAGNWATPILSDNSQGALYDMRLTTISSNAPWGGSIVNGAWTQMTGALGIYLIGTNFNTTVLFNQFTCEIRKRETGITVASATLVIQAASVINGQ